jgi:hypothetical protein
MAYNLPLRPFDVSILSQRLGYVPETCLCNSEEIPHHIQAGNRHD